MVLESTANMNELHLVTLRRLINGYFDSRCVHKRMNKRKIKICTKTRDTLFGLHPIRYKLRTKMALISRLLGS